MKAVESKTWSALYSDNGILYSDATQAPDNVAPSTPGTPVVAALGSTSLHVTWTESTDLHGIKEYILYSSTTANGTYTEIGRPLLNTWIDETLSPSTTRFYKVEAVDNSLQHNVSARSAHGSGTTTAGVTGPWQLAPGHFEPADMPMVIVHPRPDNETHAYARHRNAYYDGINPVQARIPIIIQGGAPPFYYELITYPAGMTIGSQYSLNRADNYGVITWTPTDQTTNAPVVVRVNDQDGNFIDVTFTITAGSDRFLFVSPTGSDSTGTGTISNPFATTRGWFKTQADTSCAEKIVYYRGGTHYWYLDPTLVGRRAGNGVLTRNKPLVHLGFPGETVISDFSQCRVDLENNAADFFFGGMTRQNTKLYKTSYMFVIRGNCQSYNNGGARFTWFEAPLKNHTTSFLKATEDFTGTNARGETYEWVNVAGTNEYYVTGPGGIEIFDAFTSGDRPNTLLANGVALTRVTSGALAPGQYKWTIPTGRIEFTITVRMPNDLAPAAGTNVVTATSWPGTVGTNAGSIWSDEANRIGGVNGRRYYFADVRSDKDNVGRFNIHTNNLHINGDNGAMPCFLLNVVYAVHEFARFTNCRSGTKHFTLIKSTASNVSYRYLDCTSTTNDPSNSVITMSTTKEHDPLLHNLGTEYRFCKVRITGTGTSSVCMNWSFQTGNNPDPASTGFNSRRNTFVNDSDGTNPGAIYFGNSNYAGYQDIAGDLVFCKDADAWYQSPQHGLVSPTNFQRLALASIATELDANYDVKPNSIYYGTHGATIA